MYQEQFDTQEENIILHVSNVTITTDLLLDWACQFKHTYIDSDLPSEALSSISDVEVPVDVTPAYICLKIDSIPFYNLNHSKKILFPKRTFLKTTLSDDIGPGEFISYKWRVLNESLEPIPLGIQACAFVVEIKKITPKTIKNLIKWNLSTEATSLTIDNPDKSSDNKVIRVPVFKSNIKTQMDQILPNTVKIFSDYHLGHHFAEACDFIRIDKSRLINQLCKKPGHNVFKHIVCSGQYLTDLGNNLNKPVRFY